MPTSLRFFAILLQESDLNIQAPTFIKKVCLCILCLSFCENINDLYTIPSHTHCLLGSVWFKKFFQTYISLLQVAHPAVCWLVLSSTLQSVWICFTLSRAWKKSGWSMPSLVPLSTAASAGFNWNLSRKASAIFALIDSFWLEADGAPLVQLTYNKSVFLTLK